MSLSQSYRVIHDLEVHSSRLNKEAIVEAQAKSGNDEFFQGARLALDPMITFGIKQVPMHEGPEGKGFSWNSFCELAIALSSRSLTGDAARAAIDAAMRQSKRNEWDDWYRRILIKDLRCGVSETTINKVVKKLNVNYIVPIFECQLAHDSANHDEKVTGKKIIETKLDGVRVLTIVRPTGQVDQFSRNGKELVNFPHIKEQFKKTCSGITEPVVFDGEIMSNSFQDLMKMIHRKDNVQSADAVLYVFDFIPLKEFESGKWHVPQIERSKKLVGWKDLWAEETPNINLLEQELVDLDTDAGQKKFKDINAQAIAGGYEGIMIKNPDAGYECKRSVSWLKLKPFIEVTLTVVDTEEGTGKNVGRMGALVCEGIDDGKKIRVNVGSGFTDEQRVDFWDCRADGHLIEVRADAVTQNQDGSYSLRFPRFKHFRGFAVGEKL